MTQDMERMLPLYEAKMIHHFDYRWATFDGEESRDLTLAERSDPGFQALPRYWVRAEVVEERLTHGGLREAGNVHTLLGYRWISNATNERTFISAMFPLSAVGNSLPLIRGIADPAALVALFCSFAFDYCARQKLGGQNMTFGTVGQLPMIAPKFLVDAAPWERKVSLGEWLSKRSLFLLSEWSDVDRRSQVRSELDAAGFLVFGVVRQDVEYIMETFPIVKRKDIAEHGSFRTKEMILDVYDAMQVAIDSGEPYESPIEHLLVGEPQGNG